MKLTGNTALVTGGGSGIGLALAKQLAQLGNKVVIAGRDEDKLRAAQRAVPALTIYQADISRDAERIRLAARLQSEQPGLNMLINNAGIQRHMRFDHGQPPLEHIQAEIETNLVAPVRLCSLLMELLRSQPQAAIVNISSGLAIAPKADAPVYCATKAALSNFTRALRYQLEHTPVQVYDVLAPLVDTDMTRGRGTGKISADAFAAALLRGLERGRPDIRIGKTRLLVMLHRLLPDVAYRITR